MLPFCFFRYQKRKENCKIKQTRDLTKKQHEKKKKLWRKNSKRYYNNKKQLKAVLNNTPSSEEDDQQATNEGENIQEDAASPREQPFSPQQHSDIPAINPTPKRQSLHTPRLRTSTPNQSPRKSKRRKERLSKLNSKLRHTQNTLRERTKEMVNLKKRLKRLESMVTRKQITKVNMEGREVTNKTRKRDNQRKLPSNIQKPSCAQLLAASFTKMKCLL